MNDPHVEALVYVVKHSPTFSYDKAEPYERQLPECRINIERRQATIAPKEHFATAEKARAVVEPILRAWELDAALEHDNPDVLRFVYLAPKIIDRDPTPGVARIEPVSVRLKMGDLAVCLDLGEYPAPPAGLVVRSDVAAMFDRWRRYKAGQALLGDTADFCRGALEQGGGRQAAAERYQIDRPVLDTLGELADRKGGAHARKFKGYGAPYSERERVCLEDALKKLIRRAAEVAHEPAATRPLLTMRCLTDL